MDVNELYISAVELTRYLLAALAVLITGGCVVSLVTRRFGSRVGSYLVEFKTKKRIPLTHWENSIGRSPTCDVILNVATVSRFHAVISKRRTGWVVADTGSRTGVFVNGEQIAKPVVLNHGDKVSFGTSVFEFFDVDVDDAEREAEKERRRQAKINARTGARTDNRGASFLPAIIDEAADKAYIIGCDSCTIGRSPDCDIRLRYHSLSSEHARVSKIGNGWYIEDLGSSNGTKVNARFVTNGRRKLRDGDIIGLGGVIFVFDEHYKIKKN